MFQKVGYRWEKKINPKDERKKEKGNKNIGKSKGKAFESGKEYALRKSKCN